MSIYQIGSVAHNLYRMRGVWHDVIEIFDLDGTPLNQDPKSGTPGQAPFENLVYVDFDGVHYTQTNVTVAGRPLHMRTFQGKIIDGVLHFNKLGPHDPGHIGVSGGPGILFFVASKLDSGTQSYAEPDCIRLLNQQERTRTTVLYRNGEVIRSLTAYGTRISLHTQKRVDWDPRGPVGSVHFEHQDTHVFHSNQDHSQNELKKD